LERNESTHAAADAKPRRGGVAAPLTAVVSFLAAVSCCLPVGAFVVGAGFFGAASFLGAAQPYLLALAIVSLGFGFIRTYTGKSCRVRRSRAGVVALWTAAAFVLAMFLFPQQVAGLLADLLGPRAR